MNLEAMADLALKTAQQARDYTDILNLFSMHLHSWRIGETEAEMKELWAAERDDLVYKTAMGREAAAAAYQKDGADGMKAGVLQAKASSSPYIIIAEDGKSAHGVWFVPGFILKTDESGKVVGNYVQEKNAVDFVKEADGWKLLRLNILPDFRTPVTHIDFNPAKYEFDYPKGTYEAAYSAAVCGRKGPAVPVSAKAASAKSNMTTEEKLDLAETLTAQADDYREVYNTISKMMYLLQVQKHAEIAEQLWSARDDIRFGGAEGRAAVMDFLLQETSAKKQKKLETANRVYGTEISEENLGVGDLESRLASNPVIAVAADGMTAEGVWFSPAVKAEIDDEGTLIGRYKQEQIAASFVKEDGAWKILSYDVYPDFTTRLPDYVFDDSRYQGRTFEMDGSPNEEHTNELPEDDHEAHRPKPYGPDSIPFFKPPIPEPYKTWSLAEDMPIM